MNLRGRVVLRVFDAALLALVGVGCDSRQEANLQQAQRNFDTVAKAQQDELRWKLDEATAKQLFWRYYSDAPAEPPAAYATFIRCHEEPPTKDANKKVCANLQGRVARQERKNQAREKEDSAAW